jgi:AcrR family transcriptional regulator
MAAVDLADEAGVQALTMRRLGEALGVHAMSLYNHVDNRDAILDGTVDLVLGEIDLPTPGTPWKAAIRAIAIATHDALVRHPWAAGVMLSSNGIMPARLRIMDALLASLREAGLLPGQIDLAYHALDSYISGFTLWQVQIGLHDAALPGLALGFLANLAPGAYPDLVAHVHQHLDTPDVDGPGAFVFGLDLLLDGLERLRPDA